MLSLAERYRQTRQQSVAACKPLETEDYGLQAEAFTSPPKWHIAHTSWFFETFLLKPYLSDYQPLDPLYAYLFNSYYNGIGEQFARPHRGLLSRPTVVQVFAYRDHVDQHMLQLLAQHDHPQADDIRQRCRLGIEHEQQHQELFYTDLKYSLFCNPLLPAYMPSPIVDPDGRAAPPLQWQPFAEQLIELGCAGDDFAFDNEGPRHKVYLAAYALADRLVSNAEYLQFIEDDGYQRPELWLADGWAALQQAGWQRPHYWFEREGQLCEYTLHGVQPLQPGQPVCHISAYEADAYARWAGYRLPTEAEWEHAATSSALGPAGKVSSVLQPRPASGADGLQQLYSDCWQWTSSAYAPYTGYKPAVGAIGEYNGKFMCNQLVLRGGSCVSQKNHLRPSYRNFFYPQDRWQFTGLRLAQSV
jgi:ergothioneine biosynthesis protein EgtB